jgi:hypothetical protein
MAMRADEERPVLRKGFVGPWRSRRSRARVRRAMIRELIEAAEVEPESIDDKLVERLSVYTHGEPQSAGTTSLLSTAIGPGLAAATTQTDKR